MEVVTTHERAVAIEVHTDLAPRAAPRAPALIREGRQRRDVDGILNHESASQPERVEELAQLDAVGVRHLVPVEAARGRLAAQHVGDLLADREGEIAQRSHAPERPFFP